MKNEMKMWLTLAIIYCIGLTLYILYMQGEYVSKEDYEHDKESFSTVSIENEKRVDMLVERINSLENEVDSLKNSGI